jgi:prevent-host-death family protein
MDVGIRDLKQHLSEYLERVANGETIRVTDRGHPKAIISPVVGLDHLQRGIDEGWIRPPLREGVPGQGEMFRSSIRSEDIIAEDRGE